TRQIQVTDVCSSGSSGSGPLHSVGVNPNRRRGGLVITRPKGSLRIAAIAVALALAFTACGSSSKPKAGGGTNGGGKTGGALVFGAEQWPDCINPITQCANSSWLQWLVPIHVLPRLVELDEHNNFVASPLITEMPST